MQEILSKLEASRKELLDLGLRNPLLNYRPSKVRGLQIVQESAPSVYDILVQQGKAMTFAAAKADVNHDSISSIAIADTRLQTAEFEDKLQQKLLNTYYTARTSLEEQGVNILYLALGMLHWYEADTSEDLRKAPLILIPVTLERSTARERFKLKYTGEEIEENLSLQAKMKAEFGVALPELPEAESIAIGDYFEAVETAIEHYTRWQVDRNSIELGFFSFGKFLIYNDLDNNHWPDDAQPIHHPILQSLFSRGFSDAPPSASENAFIDNETNAHELFQVVDADSSQLLAMLAVHEGRNLVIQGPPGTGKSQTITNIIANAIGEGKKVLFVAEKLAALQVVKRRLDAIELGEACLELHSHKGSKKELHAELKRVLELGKPALQHLQQQVALLHKRKEELNAYSIAVNTEIQESGYTVQQLIGLLMQLQEEASKIELPNIRIQNINNWNGESAAAAVSMAEKMQALLQNIGVPSRLHFWGSRLTLLLPKEQENLQAILVEAVNSTQELIAVSDAIALEMQWPQPQNREETLKLTEAVELAAAQPALQSIKIDSKEWSSAQISIKETIKAAEKLHQLHKENEAHFLPQAWQYNVAAIRGEMVTNGHKLFRFLISSYNKAQKEFQTFYKKPLPKNAEEKIALLDTILEAQSLQQMVDAKLPLMQELFGNNWSADADWTHLNAVTDYLEKVHQSIAAGKLPATFLQYLQSGCDAAQSVKNHQLLLENLSAHGKILHTVSGQLLLDEALLYGGSTLLHQPYKYQLEYLELWGQNLSTVHQIIAWNNLSEQAGAESLSGLTDVSIHWPKATQQLKTALLKTWYEHLLQRAFTENKALQRFERATHEQVVEQFARLDLLNLQLNRAKVALQHWEAVPKGDAGGQVNLLRTEFNKKARHLPIRKLMVQAGMAIQAIKPVFMMSPLSIANFLPPGSLEFDLVIFDEASQVRPVEALGALLRGKQLVVVGDTKQLPPTSFFDTLSTEVDDEENVTADLPSILGMCDAQGAPQRMLRWHYRSRHQSLIALSNHHFYENKLVVFPSPGLGQKGGLFYHHLNDTAYDRGGTRTNPKEAEKVAEAVMEHARLHPKLSLGVVAFSTAQRQAIQDALEIKRRQHPELESFFNTQNAEPFFVKNLENVQGDERDVIFISIGYGRSAEGYISMNFGPLNNEGGEKRLNVLITRAKLRCEVFTNITADDIDISKTGSAGLKALKSFLQYAQSGRLDVPFVSGKESQSPFEEAVATSLMQAGYRVQKQVGSAGFYIDLAIEDPEQPGRFILGVECDGASYHSARSARDRDRLRQQVLEANGWKLHRIWSTDWFRNSEREMARLVAAIDAAWKNSEPDDADEAEAVADTSILREAAEDHNQLPLYVTAALPSEMKTQEMHLHPVSKLAHWVELVVKAESPVHFDEVARRMVEAAGITRVGPRIREHIKLAARFAEGSGHIVQKGEFLWLPEMQEPVLRNRSTLPAASRKLKYIAPEEMSGVIEKVVRNAVAIHPEAAFPFIARLLGFSRVTEEMRNEILTHIQQAIENQKIEMDGELVVMPAKNKAKI